MPSRLRRLLPAATLGLVAIGAAGWWLAAAARRDRLVAALPAAPAPAALGALPDSFRPAHAARRARVAALGAGPAELGALAALYQANGFLREAMRCYAALETLEPAEPRWPHLHATLLAGFGDAAPAITRWERVLALAPDYVPARLRLAELLLKNDRPARAAELFSEVLRRAPDHPHALLGLARLDFDAGRWAEARTRLEKVIALTDYALGYDLIVPVCEKLGDHTRAAAVRARAKASGAHRDPPDPWADATLDACHDPYRLALLAGEIARAGDPAGAVRRLERAVELAPADAPVRFQLATLLAARGDTAAAQNHFERCTQAMPGFADAWTHWAALKRRTGDAAGAAALVATGLKHCPDSPALHLLRARAARDAGRADEAIAAFRESIRLRTTEADAYLELATTLFRLERVDEGVGWLERGLAVEPEHPPTLALLALHAIGAGDEPRARAWLERVARQPRVPREQAERLRTAWRERFGSVAP